MNIAKASTLLFGVFVTFSTMVISTNVLADGAPNTAPRPTYNYLGVGYMRHQVKGNNDCKQDGLVLEGSLLTNEHTFVHLSHVDVTSGNLYCGSTTTAISAGFRNDFGGTSSVYGMATLMAQDTGDDKDPGIGLQTGLRSIMAPGFEGKIFMGFDVIDDFDQSYIGIGINHQLGPTLSVNAEAFTTNENTTGLSVGLRFNF